MKRGKQRANKVTHYYKEQNPAEVTIHQRKNIQLWPGTNKVVKRKSVDIKCSLHCTSFEDNERNY